MDKADTECYKCFCVGNHVCTKKFKAPEHWCCETCGNLKSHLFLAKNYSYSYFPCLWCKTTLRDTNPHSYYHLNRCPKRPIRDFSQFIKYQCSCWQDKV